jgi:intracellular sulfur oxidation DsrE/DsrF family protein
MRYLLLMLALIATMGMTSPAGAKAKQAKPVTFVMQLTMSEENKQRLALLQIQKVLESFGPDKVKIEVVAYEGGILTLLANNANTASMVADLARQGVKFKVCRISMRASDLTENDFPLEVEFVPAGAPEMIRLQLQGARYWRP